MRAGYHNITIEQGSTFQLYVQWKDSSGNPVNLTGYSARMKIKTLKSGGSTIATLTSASEITFPNRITGMILVTIVDTATDDFDFVRGVYDLELVDGSSNAWRILEGNAFLNKEVTTT